MTQVEAARQKRTHLSALIILVLIPGVLALSILLFNNRFYMPLSIIILGLIMAPFFMVFEKRRPKAREIVLLAVMSALTVVIHLFFHVILPIQAGTAVIIIAGISLGPEAGFLIGALSRFVCNFFMGQGAWTPWQMFCWGILGFLAGFAFNLNKDEEVKSRNFTVVMGPLLAVIVAELAAYISFLLIPGTEQGFVSWRLYAFGAAGLLAGVLLQRKRLPADGLTIALFAFFTSFIIYGGIMNFASMVTGMSYAGAEEISMATLRSMYISGAPYDLVHAVSSAVFSFFLGETLINKLERVKIKYGIYKR